MTPALAEKIEESESAFTGSLDSIESVEELEHRRKLVEEGRSRLVSEEESWGFLRMSGCHV